VVAARRYPNIERVLIARLVGAELAPHAGIETPADFTGQLPFTRVRRIGGYSNRLNDIATVDIDVFHTTYADGTLLAEDIRQYLTATTLDGVDRIDCAAAPRELPWGDGTVRRWNATYRTVTRTLLVP
jgi:hypothetical protein